MQKIAVIGIGNILLRDDGIGIHVIYEMQKERQQEHIDLVDGGTSIFDLLDFFVKNDKLILVDSLKGGHPPGTVYKVTPEELGGYIKANSSLHDVQVLDILNSVKLMEHFPEVIIIGVEPKEIFYDMELTPIIKDQIPKIIEIIKEELSKKVGEDSA